MAFYLTNYTKQYMSYHKNIVFPTAREAAIAVMKKLQARVERYATKPEAKIEVLNGQRDDIAVLYEFVQLTDLMIKEMEQDVKDAYSKGYHKGRNDNPNTPDRYDREAVRSHSVFQLQKQMPHLF